MDFFEGSGIGGFEMKQQIRPQIVSSGALHLNRRKDGPNWMGITGSETYLLNDETTVQILGSGTVLLERTWERSVETI